MNQVTYGKINGVYSALSRMYNYVGWLVLKYVTDHPGITLTEIQIITGLHYSELCAEVRKLINHNLIEHRLTYGIKHLFPNHANLNRIIKAINKFNHVSNE